MSKMIWAAAILTAGTCCSALNAEQLLIPLNNSNGADNFLYNNSPTTNFGLNGFYWYDERGANNDKARPIIRFDLAPIPAGSKVTKVEYKLWMMDYTFIDTNNASAVVPWPFGIHPMKVDWSELESNWLERKPGTAWGSPGMSSGVDFDASPISSLIVSSPGNRYISWDITALYNAWSSGARPNYGFHIRGPAGNPALTTNTGDTTDGVFRALQSEYDDDTRRPQLVIDFVSCPADLNGDQFVDDPDFSIFATAYNILDCADPSMPEGCPADFNADGIVDDSDFVVFVVAYDMLLCPE